MLHPQARALLDLERLVAAGAVETDADKRKAIYQQLNQLAADQSHIIPVATNPRIFAYKNVIQRATIDLNGNMFLNTTTKNT